VRYNCINIIAVIVAVIFSAFVLVGEYNMLEWQWSAYLVRIRWSASCNYKSI